MSCFNSRAREGRDPGRRIPLAAHVVSIHAPARGATCCRRLLNRCLMFQFTRPRGARRWRVCYAPPYGSFNSRAREGRDQVEHLGVLGVDVSIHAPARGATVDRISIPVIAHVSIHAPARGATRPDGRQHRHSDVSIHAPARGATSAGGIAHSRAPRFNSRAREGRDRGMASSARRGRVSIHAPARGATRAHRNLLWR